MSNILRAPVYDKSSALDVIFGFLQLAQRRGAYSFAESAKIFECMSQFSDFFENQIPPKEDDEQTKDDEQPKDDELDEKFDSDDEKDAVPIESN